MKAIRDKILFVMAILGLLIALSIFICDFFEGEDKLRNTLSSITINLSLFSGVYLLIFNGTIKKIIYRGLTIVLILMTIIDAECTIQNYDIGNKILTLCLLLFPAGYLIRFIQKTEKTLMDWLKMISISLIFCAIVLKQLEFLSPNYILVSDIILVITCIIFWKNRNKSPEEIDFDFMKNETPTK